MKPGLPPLSALRAFEAAARCLSFSKAAAELGVTPAAISQLIRQLEQHVGSKLFVRSTRSIHLTERGRAAWPHFRDAFDQLHGGARLLYGDSGKSTITVSVSPSFGSCWLLPRLGTFHAAHPDISVRVDAREELADFSRDEVDIAIRQGRGRYKGLKSELLLKDVALLVCAPKLLPGGRPFEKPEALAGKSLIHVDWTLSPDAAPTWQRWAAFHGVKGLKLAGGLRFSLEDMAVRAAIAGMGVALVTVAFVADDLKAGRLVRALAQKYDMPAAFQHFLVYPPLQTSKRHTLKLFRAWLLDQAESNVGLDG